MATGLAIEALLQNEREKGRIQCIPFSLAPSQVEFSTAGASPLFALLLVQILPGSPCIVTGGLASEF